MTKIIKQQQCFTSAITRCDYTTRPQCVCVCMKYDHCLCAPIERTWVRATTYDDGIACIDWRQTGRTSRAKRIIIKHTFIRSHENRQHGERENIKDTYRRFSYGRYWIFRTGQQATRICERTALFSVCRSAVIRRCCSLHRFVAAIDIYSHAYKFAIDYLMSFYFRGLLSRFHFFLDG